MNSFRCLSMILLSLLIGSCSSQNDAAQTADIMAEPQPSQEKNSAEIAARHESVFACDYLGQEPPGNVPVKFAPGIISTAKDDSSFEISASGKEIVFSRDYGVSLLQQGTNGEWGDPTVLIDSGSETSFSPDGTMIYFNSRRPLPGAAVPLNVWVLKKLNGTWGDPSHLGEPVIEQTVHAPSIAADGSLYASGIICLKYIDGRYQTAERLTPDITGYHPFAAPDESYIIFDHPPQGGQRGADLSITFHDPDEGWDTPIPLGEHINTPALETNAFITPDGKYLFFTRNFDIYWVKADLLEKLSRSHQD